jgi:hypothetical protein
MGQNPIDRVYRRSLRKEKTVRIRVMVLNATFSNISVISWKSVLLVAETGVSGENQNWNSQLKW